MAEPDSGPRLSAATVGNRLPYDRASVTPGVVHLGIGAFHRAHMAAYVDDLLAGDPSWGIIGASLRRPDTRQALAPQDFLYTLAVRSGGGTALRVVGALLDVLDAATQRDALLAAMADPRIRLVSLTVTEKGYCHDPATGALDPAHPDVLHDLANPGAPVSAPGLIVRALALRRAAGAAPFTVLCCDNLPANGETTARVVAGFAALDDAALAAWISGNVAFPSTMVDRIVPATTEADRAMVREATGLADAWPVMTEPFSQWVIEDRFPAGRPHFERAGAQLVADVRPYELMKLRMLNGSHSMLAYLGYLAGHEHVSEAIADPHLRRFIHDFMTEEAMPTLPAGLGDLAAYREALLQRFANPALRHRTWQIAMDGSQKLPQRLLGTIRDRLARGLPVARATLGVAAWMRYVMGVDEQGRPIDVRDPLAERLRRICAAAGDAPEALVDGLLQVAPVFGDDLPRNAPFRAAVAGHLGALLRRGALATVRDLVG
ncbi:MAG: mannitol dehydrogenase family protein [Dongiaceae bacterium]